MTLTYIDALLAEQGLKNPSLAVLDPIADRYETLLLQPDGEIAARPTFIGNSDQNAAHAKHLSFFQLVREKAPHLAACPEYSCPWKTVSTLMQDSILPAEDALWVIGCESITPDEFAAVRALAPDITWIFSDLRARGTRTFLDPVIYLFKTRTNEGKLRNVALVQFKTQEMADRDTFLERDYLISCS